MPQWTKFFFASEGLGQLLLAAGIHMAHANGDRRLIYFRNEYPIGRVALWCFGVTALARLCISWGMLHKAIPEAIPVWLIITAMTVCYFAASLFKLTRQLVAGLGGFMAFTSFVMYIVLMLRFVEEGGGQTMVGLLFVATTQGLYAVLLTFGPKMARIWMLEAANIVLFLVAFAWSDVLIHIRITQ